MHTSLFTDTFLSDRLDDSGAPATLGVGPGPAHRAMVLRGLVVIGAFAALVGLAMISGTIHSADADAAPSAVRAPLAVEDQVAERHILRLRAPEPASIDWTSRLRQ